MTPSPIVLFLYNRPWHAQQTIRALQNNMLANQSDLFIYSDGPRNHLDNRAVGEVRDFIKTIDGFKSVVVVERTRNFGLANSIIDGVTSLCNEYGRVIVMEDDLLTSPHFLTYMNLALSKYEEEERVMHVSGYVFPVSNAEQLPRAFFYRATSCWGWGTWGRAWKTFEPSAKKLLQQIRQQKKERAFDILGTNPYTKMLKKQAVGKLDSWAVRWYASVFLQGGLCLHPARSFVNNIGHDGSGVNCGDSYHFRVEIDQDGLEELPDDIHENELALRGIADFYRSIRGSLHIRLFQRILRKIRPTRKHFFGNGHFP